MKNKSIFICKLLLLMGAIPVLAGCSPAKSYVGPKGEKGEAGAQGPQGPAGKNGEDGKDGEDGKSAFEIYCAAHPEYEGDEAQWMDDLVNGKLADVEKCSVTFDPNDGLLPDGFDLSVEVVKGDCVSLPVPTYENHTFVGWFTGNTANDGQFFSHNPVLSDMHLIARYSKITEVVLDKNASFTARDGNLVNEAKVDDYIFNFVNHEVSSSSLGSIKKKQISGNNINGLIFNKTLIDGLVSIEIDYTGAPIYFVFSEYLFDDLSFTATNANRVTSTKKYECPNGSKYFVLFTESNSESVINSIKLEVNKVDEVYNDRIYKDKENYFYNRSVPKSVYADKGFIEMENNPTESTNNYSMGTTSPHDHVDSWYRFNGVDLQKNDVELGNTFDFQSTIIGDFSMMMDSDKYFNFGIWIEFAYKDGETLKGSNWVYTFIGNDCYEPLGHLDPARVHTDYNDSYAGRFYTTYTEAGDFADPDASCTSDGLSFREGFESLPYPYWNVNYHFENNECVISINGHDFAPVELFSSGYTGQDIVIERTMLNIVNYGDTSGNPADSYKGSFTHPRTK